MFLASQKLRKYIERFPISLFIISTIIILPCCSENSRDSDWSVNLDIKNLNQTQGLNSRFEKDLSIKLQKLEGHPQIEIARVILDDHREEDFIIYYSTNSTISTVNIYIEVLLKKCRSYAIYSDLQVDRSHCYFQGSRFHRPTIKEDIVTTATRFSLCGDLGNLPVM
jgi:hypothetical protein